MTKPRIGLMLSFGVGGYSRLLVRGIREEVDRQGCPLIVFKGNFLNTQNGYLFQENSAFLHIVPKNLDILLIPTGINATIVGKEELERVMVGYGIPITVSIGNEVTGCHNILVDNKSGIRQVIEHLVRTHGVQKIGFMTGSPLNNEAGERYQAYREALEEFKLPFEEDWVLPAHFNYFSANQILKERFSTTLPRFEALVCANDEMAIEAISFFQQKGLRIPADLVVTGFDDIDEATDHLPQLTTVRQPVIEMGALSVQKGLQAWEDTRNGKARDQMSVRIPTELKIRSSCGCLARLESKEEADNLPSPMKYADGILENGPKQEAFLLEFQRLAEVRLLEGGDASQLQRLIFQVRTGLLQKFSERVTPRNLTDLMGRMQQIVFQLTRMIYSAEKESLDNIFNSRYVLIERLDSAVDLEDIASGLCKLLPQLGIEVCTVVLYPVPRTFISEAELRLPEEARILFSLGPGGIEELTEEQRRFDPRDGFLPSHLSPDGGTQLLSLLYFRELQFGYFLMSMGNTASLRYETVRNYIRNLFQQALLYRRPASPPSEP